MQDKINIVDQLSAVLAGRPEIISIALKMAIKKGKHPDTIIKTVADNIRDNELVMAEIIGRDLVTKIKSILPCT